MHLGNRGFSRNWFFPTFYTLIHVVIACILCESPKFVKSLTLSEPSSLSLTLRALPTPLRTFGKHPRETFLTTAVSNGSLKSVEALVADFMLNRINYVVLGQKERIPTAEGTEHLMPLTPGSDLRGTASGTLPRPNPPPPTHQGEQPRPLPRKKPLPLPTLKQEPRS